MRSSFVTEFGTRNSVTAGRTGTRLNTGRPQVGWVDGVGIAGHVVEGRQESMPGSNALSISVRIREALAVYRVSLVANSS